MRNGARLEIANVVGRVVHELHVPDAALMRFLEPLELPLEEIEAFHVTHDRGLPCFMRRLEIGSGKRAAQAMVGDHLVHPGEALEMVLIEQARLGRAQRGEDAGRIPAEDGSVRHVREARDRERSRTHAVREIAVGGRLRHDAGRPAMGVDIDGDRFPQDVERGGGGLGRLGGGGRTPRCHTAAEHRGNRGQHRAPYPLSARERVAVTAAIHAVLPRTRA